MKCFSAAAPIAILGAFVRAQDTPASCFMSAGEGFPPMSYSMEDAGMTGDFYCASFCWHCADSTEDDSTNEEKADGAKVSHHIAIPSDSIELYTSQYADEKYNFISCQTDDCNYVDPCSGTGELGDNDSSGSSALPQDPDQETSGEGAADPASETPSEPEAEEPASAQLTPSSAFLASHLSGGLVLLVFATSYLL